MMKPSYCTVMLQRFLLLDIKIDAKKDMTFDTDESITFTGNTGPLSNICKDSIYFT